MGKTKTQEGKNILRMSMTEFLTFFSFVQEVLTNQSNKQNLFEFLSLNNLNIQLLHINCASYKI